MMKSLVSRFKAFALLLAVALSGIPISGYAEYVAGWDMSAIWERSLVATETTVTSTPITCETPSGSTDFTMAARMTVPAELTGAAALISWDMTHNNGPLEIYLVKEATSDGVARIKLGWSWKGSGDITTYSGAGQYYDWSVDNQPHDWTITYEDNSVGTKVYLDGVKIAEVSNLRFAGLKPTINFGGATGSVATGTYPVATGLVVHAASYRQGNTFPTSLTSNGYTLNFNGNTPIVGGVAIGSATTGLSVSFASGDNFYNGRTISAVLEIENAPTAASDAMLVNFSYNGNYYIGLRTNGSTLYQSWGGASTGYGSASWTPASHQTVTFTSDRSSDATRGTRTIIGSTEKIGNVQSLCAGADLRSVQLGYYSSSSQIATGLKIYSIKLYTTKLDASDAASAMNDVIIYDGSTVELGTGNTALYCGSGFTKGFTLDLKGQTVNLDPYPGTTGTITINDTTGAGSTTLDIGTARPTIGGLASGATLAVMPTSTLSQQIEGYTATVELPVTVNSLAGTVTLNGDTVTPVIENGIATLTTVVPSNPSYTGDSWWWDYEFDYDPEVYNSTYNAYESKPNDGNADNTVLFLESTAQSRYTSADESGNRELYFQQTPWRNANFNDKSELTAVMYCAPGNYANTVLVGFGSTTANDQKAIALVTGANPAAGEMKLVLTDGHSGGTGTVTKLADLTAVGATTTKHLYAFVMDRITENETEKTRVRVYLDGKVKAIYKHNGTLTLSNGFQIGSLHGGVAPRNNFVTGFSKYSATGNSGTLDFLRVIDGTLTDAAMANLAAAYPYNSTHGEATRDPISSAANWVATDVWTQKVPNQSDAPQDAPNADTNVKLSIDGSSAVSVALNLEDDSNYESVTFSKEAGATGSLKVTSAYNNATTGKLVSAETSVLVDTTVPAGRVHLGITSVGDGVTLTIDPYSMMGSYLIYSKLAELPLGGVWEDEIISMALLGEGARVTLGSQNTLNNLGFSATLVYNESNQSYTYRLTRESASSAGAIAATAYADGSVTWVTHNIVLPAPETIPSDYANTVTIDASAYDGTITIPTAFAGGNVTVAAGGSVNLTGAITTSGNLTLNSATTLSGTSTIVGAMSGSATLTVDGSVTVASTGSIANTIAGDGTITFEALPASAPSFGAWTGTVVLPANQAFDGQKFDDYGIAGSTVRLQGANTGWFNYGTANNTQNRAPVATTIEIPSGASLTVTAFSPSYANTFNVLTGAGTFAVNISGEIDISDSSYSAYFLLKNVSNFTGSLSATGAGIAIGASKPVYQTAGGKILLTSADAVLTVSTVPSPVPTSGVDGYSVWTSTSDGNTVYSLANAETSTMESYTDGDDSFEVPVGWMVAKGLSSASGLGTDAANGLTFFECYALGLDPADSTDEPVAIVTVNGDGNFVVVLKHADGTSITPAGNVSITYSLLYGDSADNVVTSQAGTTFAPPDATVRYYKVVAAISPAP